MATPAWLPNWQQLLSDAPLKKIDSAQSIYFVADSHLDQHATALDTFCAEMAHIPDGSTLIFLGDLFKVWIALPQYTTASIKQVLDACASLKNRHIQLFFVVGNHEFFMDQASSSWLPFDWIIPEMGIIEWGDKRYVLTHGDMLNRQDHAHLRWRHANHKVWFKWIFNYLLPAGFALNFAKWLENYLKLRNLPVKMYYPQQELKAFANVASQHVDGVFVGHFHRNRCEWAENKKSFVRIVPDWLSSKQWGKLTQTGELTFENPPLNAV